MEFNKTFIPDVVILKPKIFGDERGFFLETFRESDFIENVADVKFVQDNHSGSSQGILRGLHFQSQHSQGKLIRAVSGEIFNVAVDLRRNSPTYGKWVGVILSAQNKWQFWIPPFFAHGFYVMSEWAEVFYKATDYYAPEYEHSIKWNDPTLGIDWPLLDGKLPRLSDKDQNGCLFQNFEFFE